MSDDRTLPANLGLTEDEFVKAAQENQGFTRDESVIPFIKIMQPQSPEIGTIPGAVAGSFLHVPTSKTIDGKTGMIVIPVLTIWNYTEWSAAKGDGGTLVKDWGEDESGWQAQCEVDQKTAYMPITKMGNHIQKSRHFYLFMIDDEGNVDVGILAMAATALKVARGWASMMQNAPKISTKNGLMTPAYFYYTYKLTLNEVKNQKGRWFQPFPAYNMVDNRIVPVLEMPNGKNIWDAALSFRDSFRAGDIKAASQIETPDDDSI